VSDKHFLPWMRVGLAASIEGDGNGSALIQPAVDVVVDDGVHPVSGPEIQLRGPGDVLALNPAEIKRRDPEAGAVGAETNYFCAVEFFAPDLPWRYTPMAVADGQLPPWLVLVVVELGDGVTLSSGGRLPVLSVDSPADHLPDLADSWAWAHVQSAVPIDGTFAKAYDADPTAFTSRLLCPRRLRADTSYTACLVPAFDSGRQAGLGLAVTPSADPAWTSRPVELPVYDSWELAAGDRFDFKTLAKRIKPAELPEDVGFRDLDLTDPGPGIRPISTPATFVGAMHAPTDSLEYWHDDDDRVQFETDIRQRLVSSAPKRDREGAAYDPLVDDPVVTPTVYGAPQVGTSVVPESAESKRGWFEELNIGPHHRAVAGLGAEVVRADQESLMAAAWEQARAAIDVNRQLNRGRLSTEVAAHAERKWAKLDDATAVSIAAPAFVSMRVDGSTAKRLVVDGEAPAAYFGAAFRRLGRTNGPLSTRATVAAAQSPAIAITRAVLQTSAPDADSVVDPLSTAYRKRFLPAGMDCSADVDESSSPVIVAGGERPRRGPSRRRSDRPRTGRQRDVPTDGNGPVSRKAVTSSVPFEPFDFEVERPGTDGRIITTVPGTDDVGVDLAATTRASVQPVTAIRDSVRSLLVVSSSVWEAPSIPTRVGLQPRFTDPMYERVRALSVDYLVPGVGTVPNNTLSLLEINPAYIEAFLVGLNHEMSRELRWREYPAALGQTWFQHFFDNVDPAGAVDVRPIDSWTATAPLGHEYGQADGLEQGEEEGAAGLVVLIKADLIRKYPDVRVYAVPATIDEAGDRVPLAGAEPEFPNFVGTLQRGVNFYGFDTLTEEEARGDGVDNDGWFFVLEEEPRAMRFGLDIGKDGNKGRLPGSWDNLAWAHLAATENDPVPWFCSIDPPNQQFTDEDLGTGLEWGDDAAVMAAITFRRPIQVFMHASAMLPPGGSSD
jgi:hypothetical protein